MIKALNFLCVVGSRFAYKCDAGRCLVMAHLNPFLHQVDESLDSSGLEEGLTSDAPYKLNISLESIAEELLKKQFILTALEFHTEIQERGREVNRLSNYFSNPSNFEQQITSKDGYSANALCSFNSFILNQYACCIMINFLWS